MHLETHWGSPTEEANHSSSRLSWKISFAEEREGHSLGIIQLGPTNERNPNNPMLNGIADDWKQHIEEQAMVAACGE